MSINRVIVRAVLLGVLLLVTFILAYGYWHVFAHGWLYVSVRDVSNKANNGRVFNAEILLLDSEKALLAEGKTDDRYGVVYISHPEAGYCVEHERQASFAKEAREAWHDCFAKFSRWLVEWVTNVRYMDLSFGKCNLKQIPVQVAQSKGNWWLWWVPHPHIGGSAYTTFSIQVQIDGVACRIVATRHAIRIQ